MKLGGELWMLRISLTLEALWWAELGGALGSLFKIESVKKAYRHDLPNSLTLPFSLHASLRMRAKRHSTTLLYYLHLLEDLAKHEVLLVCLVNENSRNMKDLPCSSNSSCVNNGVVPISKNLPHLHSLPSNPFSIQSQLKINIPTQACQQNIMTPSKHGIGVLVNGVLSQNSLNNSTKFKIAFSSQKKKKDMLNQS